MGSKTILDPPDFHCMNKKHRHLKQIFFCVWQYKERQTGLGVFFIFCLENFYPFLCATVSELKQLSYAIVGFVFVFYHSLHNSIRKTSCRKVSFFLRCAKETSNCAHNRSFPVHTCFHFTREGAPLSQHPLGREHTHTQILLLFFISGK